MSRWQGSSRSAARAQDILKKPESHVDEDGVASVRTEDLAQVRSKDAVSVP